jgi:Ca2+-binding EF-hand superfamily protein
MPLLGNFLKGSYLMKKLVFGGAALAALVGGTAVAAGTAAKPPRGRPNYFATNELRADVPKHVEKMFARFDVNHDGSISKDEVAAAQALFEARAAKSAPKRASHLFDRLDTNHDGQITQAELEAARAARNVTRRVPVNASRRSGSSPLFVRADANKDGILTRAEFDAAVASGKVKPRHPNMRGAAIARLFDSADTDNDGRVSLGEAQRVALQHFDAADLNHDGTLTPQERRQSRSSARRKLHRS